jgi:ribonucleoside-triphosphate reductase
LSIRADIITRRTYCRPLETGGFEVWGEVVSRVASHQRWLWERALNRSLTPPEFNELQELYLLMYARKALPSGRSLWLGGTEIAKRREASQFNCSFLNVETVHDAVDALWLLLQGCGVGFRPVYGTLSGFARRIPQVDFIRTQRVGKGGLESNQESYAANEHVWTLKIGDSAEAWAKSLGKLLAGKRSARRLIIDCSEIRPAGDRLTGYGWISSGDETLVNAYRAIVDILNRRAGQLLSRLDIMDIINWIGTILSTRRSAELCLLTYGEPEWYEFATAKKDYWEKNPQRSQSNNSLVFYEKPRGATLKELFEIMVSAGGSEPGFINGSSALTRAPWFKGFNPCAEILLGNRSFCNLTELDVAAFKDDFSELLKAAYLIGRANYRQTLVNLDDGILQRAWHENNEYLRLCGVGITGIVRCPHLTAYDLGKIRDAAVSGTNSMARELGTQMPKLTTTIKPSGTLSKIMDTTEGVHRPLGQYIINNVEFSKHDELVDVLRKANYHVFDHPYKSDAILVAIPVSYEDVKFEVAGGVSVNQEPAVQQLNRYKWVMQNYVDHNCSVTVSYSPDEVPEITDWLDKNWDDYVAVSFLFRNDPTKSAKDLGHLYLPQEVVTKEKYIEYVKRLEDVSAADLGGELINVEDCPSGACPVR